MKKNNSLDGHTRKRIYLFRHGEVNYMPEGKVVKDPNEVDLTDKGLMQARLIDKNTKKYKCLDKDVHVFFITGFSIKAII